MTFTYDFYSKLLKKFSRDFHPITFMETIDHNSNQRNLLIRHDVDLSVAKARELAEVEYTLGYRSTFMFIPNYELYSFEDNSVRSDIKAIRSMEHEIALHFDYRQHSDQTHFDLIEALKKDKELMEDTLDIEIKSFSFHRPLPEQIGIRKNMAGLVNAYAPKFIENYISDSGGVWRIGNPLEFLPKQKSNFFQILTHPVWWNERHQSPKKSALDLIEKYAENSTEKYRQRISNIVRNNVPRIFEEEHK